MRARVYACECMCGVCMCVCACLCARMHLCAFVCMCALVCAHVSVCMRVVCVSACERVRTVGWASERTDTYRLLLMVCVLECGRVSGTSGLASG